MPSPPPSQSPPSPTSPESQSPHHENPTSSPPPPPESKTPDPAESPNPNLLSLLKIDEKTPIPATSPEKRGDPSSSPLRHDGQPVPPLPLPSPPKNTPINPATPTAESTAAAAVISVSAVAIASRFSRDELELGGVNLSTKVGGGNLSTRRRVRRRVGTGDLVVVGGRVSAAVLCLVALAVMVADKTDGWAGDSFDRYIEFRYLIGANAISFAYSSFQIFLDVHHLVTDKYIIGFPVRYLVDLSMDQILAYLLMSASSAAASRNDVWVSRFGSDNFTKMADGSIAVSFLAFLALAFSSVISARNLFRWKS